MNIVKELMKGYFNQLAERVVSDADAFNTAEVYLPFDNEDDEPASLFVQVKDNGKIVVSDDTFTANCVGDDAVEESLAKSDLPAVFVDGELVMHTSDANFNRDFDNLIRFISNTIANY